MTGRPWLAWTTSGAFVARDRELERLVEVLEGLLDALDLDVRVLGLERLVEPLDLRLLTAADLLVPDGQRHVAGLGDVGLRASSRAPRPPSRRCRPVAARARRSRRPARAARAAASTSRWPHWSSFIAADASHWHASPVAPSSMSARNVTAPAIAVATLTDRAAYRTAQRSRSSSVCAPQVGPHVGGGEQVAGAGRVDAPSTCDACDVDRLAVDDARPRRPAPQRDDHRAACSRRAARPPPRRRRARSACSASRSLTSSARAPLEVGAAARAGERARVLVAERDVARGRRPARGAALERRRRPRAAPRRRARRRVTRSPGSKVTIARSPSDGMTTVTGVRVRARPSTSARPRRRAASAAASRAVVAERRRRARREAEPAAPTAVIAPPPGERSKSRAKRSSPGPRDRVEPDERQVQERRLGDSEVDAHAKRLRQLGQPRAGSRRRSRARSVTDGTSGCSASALTASSAEPVQRRLDRRALDVLHRLDERPRVGGHLAHRHRHRPGAADDARHLDHGALRPGTAAPSGSRC